MVICGHLLTPNMPRPDGIGQGISVKVSTELSSGENYERVLQAIRNIFPEFPEQKIPTNENFPSIREKMTLSSDGLSIAKLLNMAAEQRVLDTALDSMSQSDSIHRGITEFQISRQAAYAGKLSFAVFDDYQLGGFISIKLEGDDLPAWLEEATWHPGRDEVPRSVGDDLTMGDDGAPTTWID